MGEVAFAAAVSHAPGLTGWFEKASPGAQERIRAGYDAVARELAGAGLDVLVVVANDHLANFRVTAYPDFTVALSPRHEGPDEWYRDWLRVDDYSLPGDPVVAGAIFEGLGTRGVRTFAARENLRYDDNLSVPVALLALEHLGLPVVPIVQNCTVPPVPDERTCYEIGRQLGEVVANDLPDGTRVGILGSGGLSHEPGGPRYLEIDEKFDRDFVHALELGDHEAVLATFDYQRMEEAGAGGTAELLAWYVVMGAIGERACTCNCYEVVREWRCGVGAVTWSV